MNKQTVYIPTKVEDICNPDVVLATIGNTDIFMHEKEAYVFTPEELKQLLSDAFDAGHRICKGGFLYIPSKREYIENLLNKEK